MKQYIIAILACSLLGLTGCYNDDSTLATEESLLNDIVIADLPAMTAIAFNTVLEIQPKISGYPEEELSYAWYIYGDGLDIENGFRTVQISTEKDLSYEVNLRKGAYTLVLEVTHSTTGYAMQKEMSLTVSTNFSQGFYILKEDAAGNTELDIYNSDNDLLLTDILKGSLGEAFKGAPRNLNIIYDKAYVDPEDASSGYTTMAVVSTEDNEVACFRTEDMLKVFDRSNLLYGGMSGDEEPYCMASASYSNFYFSSKGVRVDYGSMFGSEFATGIMSYPVGSGSSKFIQACDGNGLLYWDQQNHRLMFVDGFGSAVDEVSYDGNEIIWDNVEALATGWNHLVGVNTLWYLFEDNNGERYLVFIDTYQKVTEVRRLNNSLHLAQANLFAGDALTSYSLYAVHNNKLYRYSLDPTGTETELTVTGLPSGDIVFISDIFFSSYFNYFAIGVQNGNKYTLCLYEIRGGQPYGSPLYTTTGEGKLKDVRYVSQSIPFFVPNYYAFTNYAVMYGMGPDFPY